MLKDIYRQFNETFISTVYSNKSLWVECRTQYDGYGNIDTLNSGGFVPNYGYHTKVETVKLLKSTSYSYLNVQSFTGKVVDTEDLPTIDISYDNGYSWSTGYSAGDIFKNDTVDLRGYTWVTTNSLTIPRMEHSSCGTTSGTLAAGGTSSGGGLTPYSSVEKFTGSVWATTSALPEAVYFQAMCGTTTDALSFGGFLTGLVPTTNTRIWGGSSWATTSSLNVSRAYLGGCGTTAAALSFGSYGADPNNRKTEIWNGSTWSTTTAQLVNSPSGLSGCGTTASAICVCTVTCETWNGSSWSTHAVPSLTSNPAVIGTSSTDAVCFSDSNCFALVNNVWTTTSGISRRSREELSGSGNSTTSILAIGGLDNSTVGVPYVDKRIQNNNYTKVRFNIPTAFESYVWVTTSSLNRRVDMQTSFGDGISCISTGGRKEVAYCVNYTEGFDGRVWVTTSSQNTLARGNADSGIGTSRTSGMTVGGSGSGAGLGILNTTEVWSENMFFSGGVWSVSKVYPISVAGCGSCGTPTAALVFGGYTSTNPHTPVNKTYKFNGTIWSTVQNIPVALFQSIGVGTTASALSFGGVKDYPDDIPPAHGLKTCMKWNSPAWSTTSATIFLRHQRPYCAGFGSTASAVCIGETDEESTNNCEWWNGSIWSTTTSALARDGYVKFGSANGSATNGGIHCGGQQSTGALVRTSYKWLKAGKFNGFFILFR